MGKRTVVLCFFWVWALCVHGQSIREIDLQIRKIRNEAYWIFSGKAYLPEGSVLDAAFFFDRNPISGTGRQVTVKKKRFQYTIGPIPGRAWSGNYLLVITYRKEFQPFGIERSDPFVHKQEFFYGTLGKAREARNEYALFFERITEESSRLGQEMAEYHPGMFSDEKEDRPKTEREWIEKVEERLEGIRQSIARMVPPHVLAPYAHPQTVVDLRDIVVLLENGHELCCEQFFPSRKQKKATDAPALEIIGPVHEIEPPPKPEEKKKRTREESKKILEEHARSILQLGERIVRREPLPRNLGMDDLKRSLVWFDKMYGQLTRAYRRQKTEWDEAGWEKDIKEFEIAMDDFLDSLKEYERSSLISEFPGILEKMHELEKGARGLASSYTRELWHANGKPFDGPGTGKQSSEEWMERLRRQFSGVYEHVAQNEKDRQIRKKEELERFLSLLERFSALLQEFHGAWEKIGEETPERERFLEWHDRWKEGPKMFLTQLSEFKSDHFPEIKKQLHVQTREFLLLTEGYCKIASREKSSADLAYRHRYYRLSRTVRAMNEKMEKMRQDF